VTYQNPPFSISYIVRVGKKCVYRTIKRISLFLTENFYKNNNYTGGEDEVIEIDKFKIRQKKI